MTVRYGNSVFIRFENDTPSRSFGTTSDGRIENAKRIPSRGANHTVYSDLGALLGRTSVHHKIRTTVLDAFELLEDRRPRVTFVLGEAGWPSGGRFRPHRTHRNGLSVDFMSPVRDLGGKSIALPTGIWNKFGYNIEFDSRGATPEYRIDFDAMAAHLLALHEVASAHGLAIEIVFFDPRLQVLLFAEEQGRRLPDLMRFSTKPSWVRHDEHYHVDFRLTDSSR